MTVRNDRGDELIYHGGPLDGQPLNVLAPSGPHDDEYEVRTDDGRILGAWWALEKLTMVDFLRAVDTHSQDGCARLIEAGYIPKVVYAKALKAAHKGYYEYGVSHAYGWLTPEGRRFLAAQSDSRDDA